MLGFFPLLAVLAGVFSGGKYMNHRYLPSLAHIMHGIGLMLPLSWTMDTCVGFPIGTGLPDTHDTKYLPQRKAFWWPYIILRLQVRF